MMPIPDSCRKWVVGWIRSAEQHFPSYYTSHVNLVSYCAIPGGGIVGLSQKNQPFLAEIDLRK